MRKAASYFIILLVALPIYVEAQDKSSGRPLPLEKLEDIERLQNALRAIDQLRGATDAMAKTKSVQCMKAIGNREFCDCIAAKSPIAVDFVQYVAIVARTKEEMNYDRLSREEREIVDATRKSRDLCVK